MSLLYFDGMDQYAAIADPTSAAPVQWTAGASPAILTTVATDPSIFSFESPAVTFHKHLNNDRVYISTGYNGRPSSNYQSIMYPNGVCSFFSSSSNSGLDTYYWNYKSANNGFTLFAPDTVGNMSSWTIGYKLKTMVSPTTGTLQIAAFGINNGMTSSTPYGIVIDQATGNVFIRTDGGQGLLNAQWPVGTFTDITNSGFIGTTNFVWAPGASNATAPATVANLTANTVEFTLYDTGRISVWINNLYVGSATFANTSIVQNSKVARIGLPRMQQGAGVTAFQFVGVSDLYTLNGLGTRNTSRLGKVKVVSRTPKTDVSVQFTRPDNANSNADVVGQTPAKISPALTGVKTGDKDIYGSTAFNFTNEAIIATAVTTTGYKTDPTGNDIAPVLRVGSTDFVGNTNVLPVSTTTMKQDQHIYEVNPATNQAFTKTDLDATTFGVTVVAPGT